MDSSYTIALDLAPQEDDQRMIRDGLDAYNQEHVGAAKWRPFAVFVRDADNQIVGGLLGGDYWGWLFIETLWLDQQVRRHGYGSQLMRMAEQEALARGCRYAHVDTMEFQALPFYERHGYTVYGTLDDVPAGTGQHRYFLRKTLQSEHLPGEG